MDMRAIKMLGKALVLMLSWVVIGSGLYGLIQAITWVASTKINATKFNVFVMVGAGGTAVALSVVVLGALVYVAYVWRSEGKADALKRAKWKAIRRSNSPD